MPTRRTLIAGAAMSLLAAPAFARATQRTPLPGGGSVILPNPYKSFPPGDYRYSHLDALVAYRNWRPTMAGANESDGGLAVALPSNFESLGLFVRSMRGAMTSRFSNANESEGRWYGRPETFPETPGEGANGPELIGKLQVHVVGWTVHDAPGTMFAVNDQRGVMIAVWLFDRHGGEKQARRLAEKVAASFAT